MNWNTTMYRLKNRKNETFIWKGKVIQVASKYTIGMINTNKFNTKMKIIEYRNCDDIDVQFLDSYGYIKKHVTTGAFKNGSIKNPYDVTVYGVGYLGVGEYNTWQNRKLTREYETWKNMLRRCYSEEAKNIQRSYYGIATVCEEWKNFQNFARWYNEHYYEVNERLHLDKDILIPGNTIYSPKTCMLVPQSINEIFHGRTKDTNLPTGISKTKSGRYSASHANNSLGTYKTLEEAYDAYAKDKERIIKQRAEEQKDIIPKYIYDVLCNYKVELENDKYYQSA